MKWEEISLEFAPLDIIDGDRGVNYPKTEEFFDSGYCLFLNTGNVTLTGFDFSKNQFINQEKDAKLRKGKLKRDDLVLTTRGTLGNVGFYSENIPFENLRINSGMVVIRVSDPTKIFPKYFYYSIRNKDFQTQISNSRSGSAQPQIPIGTLKKLKIRIPSLPTQQKIASILSAYDDLIENNLKRIRLLEEAAQHLYREWFVRFRFPGWEEVEVVDGLPEGWRKGVVTDLFILQRGFDLPSQERVSGEYPIVASTGIVGYHAEFKVQFPGVVTGRSGTIGKVSFLDQDFWPLNTSLWVREYINCGPHFVYFFLKSFGLENLSGGVAVPSLDRNVVHSQACIVPSFNILSKFELTARPIFLKISNLTKQNQKLKEARDILLPRLMNRTIEV